MESDEVACHEFASKKFAELLMELVRDTTIARVDRYVKGEMGGDVQRSFDSQMCTGDRQRDIEALVPHVVDRTLASLGHLLESGELPLFWHCKNGVEIPVSSIEEGVIAGAIMDDTDEGWRQLYSSERRVDI